MDENINIRVNASQKKALVRMANLSNKKLSAYARDVLLSQTLDTAKMEFYQSINDNLLELKRSNYVLTRLVMLFGSQVLKDEDGVIQFFKDISKEAEEKVR